MSVIYINYIKCNCKIGKIDNNSIENNIYFID